MIGSFVLSLLVELAGQPAVLVGQWQTTGASPPDSQGRTISYFREYKFAADGTFVMTGYPPIEVKGKWAATAAKDGKTYSLELTQQKMGGSDWPNKKEDVVVESGGDKLKWGNEIYARVKNAK